MQRPAIDYPKQKAGQVVTKVTTQSSENSKAVTSLTTQIESKISKNSRARKVRKKKYLAIFLSQSKGQCGALAGVLMRQGYQ